MVEITIRKRLAPETPITQRKFFRKTARGNVVKVLRERYLRDDVSCGILGCTLCSTTEGALPDAGDRRHKLFPNGHFLLPDTNVFLGYMDLLESSLFNPPIILLQTVMEEVRHRSLPLHKRLKALLKLEEKRVWIFYNEFRTETAVFREDGETPNDANDRSIRKAALWYNTHFRVARLSTRPHPSRLFPPIVLMTEDAINRQKAESEKIPCISVRKYVEEMEESVRNQLLDLLPTRDDHSENDLEPSKAQGKRILYPEYLSAAALVAGVRSQKLFQGHFVANPYNYLEGSVTNTAYSSPILLIGRSNMNRAMGGDVVVIEVFPQTEWRAPGDEVIDQEKTLKDDDADKSEAEDEIDVSRKEEKVMGYKRKGDKGEKQPTGRVVGIIKRSWRSYVCHVDSTSLASHAHTSLSLQTIFATPLSRSLPRIRLRTRQAPALVGQKILVTIDRWDPTSRYPEGHFVRALGQVGGQETETESILLEYEVPYRPFGKAVLDCLPTEGDAWKVPEDKKRVEWVGREDLRDLLICSIDPPGCQDIDDALHARRLPNGNIEAGVHIADVSHFVLPDTAMDREAASRGTTVYLVDKRIDMLPALLGTNLCSLKPHVERLAFSVIWELTDDAKVISMRFTKSVIASKCAFTYEEAQIRKDDPNMTDPLTASIRLLNSLAIELKAARMAAGALNLASPEVKIHLESAESSDPVDVEQKEMRETNSLVEEFMLLANISVAKRIWEAWPSTAVLRRHLPPPHENFDKLRDVLVKRKGIALDVSSSSTLAASLDKCIDPTSPSFNTLVRIMATRCMLPAEYFCSGSVGKDTFRHYGLASEIYTHFTSPIRRYADVLVHRQLAAAIGYTPLHGSLHSKSYVDRTAEVINRRHRMAQMASRASIDYFVGVAIKGRTEASAKAGQGDCIVEEAFVIRTFRNGLGVFVSKLGVEGLVLFTRDATVFDAEQYTLTIDGTTISVFDKIHVSIEVETDRNTQRGKVKMSLANLVA